MTLTNLLDKLGDFFSKAFIIGSFIPVLMFSFLNGVLLYCEVPWFTAWFDAQRAAPKAFEATSFGVGLVIAAYMLSSISVFLREVLEGKHLVPLIPPLERRMKSTQQARRDHLWNRYETNRNSQRTLADSLSGWMDEISAAQHDREDQNYVPPNPNGIDFSQEADRKVTELVEARSQGGPIGIEDLHIACRLLCQALRQRQGDDEALSALTDSYYLVAEYADERWATGETESLNRLRSRFGSLAVAPTAMGNVANSMQDYAQLSYRLNLNVMWSRLERVISDNKEASSTLSEAKTQLDFLVASCWLTALTWIGWSIYHGIAGSSVLIFLLVAVGGPALTWLFYSLATTNYSVFANFVECNVDLHRFELLEKLHIPAPSTLRQERETWTALNEVATLGADSEISYSPAKGGSA